MVHQPAIRPQISQLLTLLTAVLSTAQQFMRERLRDECSFVSLRDVERSLRVLLWFLDHRDPLFRLMDENSTSRGQAEEDEEGDDGESDVEENPATDTSTQQLPPLSPICVARLILSLAVCYHSSLQHMRESFDKQWLPCSSSTRSFASLRTTSAQYRGSQQEIETLREGLPRPSAVFRSTSHATRRCARTCS